jgi:glycerophosphoryl diester phosphodiesterase
MQLGVDLVEFDVQLTRDGHFVVIHDKRVDRTTNGQGYVAEMSLAELKALDAGAGETVPTLQELLKLTSGRVGLMLEIITPGIAADVVKILQTDFTGPVVYSSFHHAEVLKVRQFLPQAETLVLLEGVPVPPTAFAKEAAATHVGLAIDSITEDFVKSLQREKLRVFAYTANDPRDIDWLKRTGVDGIVSDFPDRL